MGLVEFEEPLFLKSICLTKATDESVLKESRNVREIKTSQKKWSPNQKINLILYYRRPEYLITSSVQPSDYHA